MGTADDRGGGGRGLKVEDRATDTLKPLIAIAGLARGHWPATAGTAAVVLATGAA